MYIAAIMVQLYRIDYRIWCLLAKWCRIEGMLQASARYRIGDKISLLGH